MGGGERRGARGLNVLGLMLSLLLLPLLLLLLLIINLTLVAKSFLYPDRVPDFMGYKPLIVLSGSMRPTILEGDLIITRQTEAAQLQPGDIVAYRLGQVVITHRVERIEG